MGVMGAEYPGLHQEFVDRFSIVTDPAMIRAEKRVIGADYGASSYTTRAQADDLAERLELGSGVRLLDVGSGPGWPGNYLTTISGCRSVLIDPTLEGMAVAWDRARRDGLDSNQVVGLGDQLPLRDGSFDAVTSSDVLC